MLYVKHPVILIRYLRIQLIKWCAGSMVQQMAKPPPPPLKISKNPSKVKILTATKRKITQEDTCFLWDSKLLETPKDSIEEILSLVLKKSALSILFLSRFDNSKKSKTSKDVFHFISKAGFFLTAEGQVLWKGIRWNSQVAPEFWQQLLKKHAVEFAPPGAYTNIGSQRNIIRTIFCASPTEWLTFIRVGDPKDPLGIFVILTTQSIVLELQDAVHLAGSLTTLPDYLKIT